MSLQAIYQLADASKVFVIVRHGNTFAHGETPRRIGARTDLPLTSEGVEQARALGAFFSKVGLSFDEALTSPLSRARETAHAILSYQGSPPKPVNAEFLREIDYGPDENKVEEEVLGRVGAESIADWELRAKAPRSWIAEPEKRISAWRELFSLPRPNVRVTLLATSNGAARYALLANSNLSDAASQLDSLKMPTGGFGVITRKDDGQLHLVNWGMRP